MKSLHWQFAILFLLPVSVWALSSPPAGAIVVGSNGQYSTLSAALADTSSTILFVETGTYTEQVHISRANLRIYGQTNVPGSYSGNTVTITGDLPASVAGSNDASGTVQVHAENVSLYNLDIANTYGHPVEQSQAIALSVQASQFGGYGLRLTGFQDTLLANKGDEFFSSCWIEGATDFIFGMSASLWITDSVINTVANGFVTASGRSSNDSNWFVIDNSVVQGTRTSYLGRPWRDYARVVFQNTYLHSNVPSAGWSVWNPGTSQTDHVTFAEYNNTGPGSLGVRANFSTTLKGPVSISTVLGSIAWIDPHFL